LDNRYWHGSEKMFNCSGVKGCVYTADVMNSDASYGGADKNLCECDIATINFEKRSTCLSQTLRTYEIL
jgi:hypothetical protein